MTKNILYTINNYYFLIIYNSKNMNHFLRSSSYLDFFLAFAARIEPGEG